MVIGANTRGTGLQFTGMDYRGIMFIRKAKLSF